MRIAIRSQGRNQIEYLLPLLHWWKLEFILLEDFFRGLPNLFENACTFQ